MFRDVNELNRKITCNYNSIYVFNTKLGKIISTNSLMVNLITDTGFAIVRPKGRQNYFNPRSPQLFHGSMRFSRSDPILDHSQTTLIVP